MPGPNPDMTNRSQSLVMGITHCISLPAPLSGEGNLTARCGYARHGWLDRRSALCTYGPGAPRKRNNDRGTGRLSAARGATSSTELRRVAGIASTPASPHATTRHVSPATNRGSEVRNVDGCPLPEGLVGHGEANGIQLAGLPRNRESWTAGPGFTGSAKPMTKPGDPRTSEQDAR